MRVYLLEELNRCSNRLCFLEIINPVESVFISYKSERKKKDHNIIQ